MSESRTGRAIRLLGHPAAPPVLLLVLVFDALLMGMSVAHRSPRNNRSVVGTWLADRMNLKDGVRVHHLDVELDFIRTETGELIVVPEDQYDLIRDAPVENLMGRVHILARRWRDGWYAPTRYTRGLEFYFSPYSATVADQEQIMRMVENGIEYYASDLYVERLGPPFPRVITMGSLATRSHRYTMERSSPRPIGWVHNALTATVAMAFLVSLGMVAWRGLHRLHRTAHE